MYIKTSIRGLLHFSLWNHSLNESLQGCFGESAQSYDRTLAGVKRANVLLAEILRNKA